MMKVVPVHRVRIMPVTGYWETCCLIVVASPDQQGVCQCFKHNRDDLSLEQARILRQRILDAGIINPENGWAHNGTVLQQHLVDG